MYTFSQLEPLIDFYLGAENIYDSKLTAANAAREHILMNHDVRSMIRTSTLTFTSGVSPKPDNYLRAVKMMKADDSSYEYHPADEDQFDQSLSRHFTLKYHSSSGEERFFIQPTSVASATLRYVRLPDDMADDSDSAELGIHWRQAHAAYSAWWLLWADRQPAADSRLAIAQELAESALVTEKRELSPTDEVSTVYDKTKLLDE